ncbi:MAG: hypothetical protein JRE23_01815 [Deltaproteobacteria bacterium]|nr:hypothetical protein [Deltaproteobacteria bacterium]
MKQLKILVIIVVGVSLLFISHAVHAKVTGSCANCHTMHNSQNGTEVVTDPQPALTVNNCVGCHSSTDSDPTYELGDSTVPVVYNTNGASTYLAGGNFYWVAAGDDTKGHNIFSDNPDALSTAPGGSWGTGCDTNSCHNNLHTTYNDGPNPGLDGRQGCTKCHMVDDQYGPSGFHHADDSNIVVGSELNDQDGYYRFLKGHQSADDRGVSGIEDNDWQYTRSSTDHNEYLGKQNALKSKGGLGNLDNTMTGYCCGCHGDFHGQNEKDDGSGNWIRHPSDAVIPSQVEYANAFGAAGTGEGTYNPLVPVARPSLSVVKGTVALGTDLVMCLSCHRPHGSPYSDMLRWDYENMIAGGGGADGTGCFVCHTNKDGS